MRYQGDKGVIPCQAENQSNIAETALHCSLFGWRGMCQFPPYRVNQYISIGQAVYILRLLRKVNNCQRVGSIYNMLLSIYKRLLSIYYGILQFREISRYIRVLIQLVEFALIFSRFPSSSEVTTAGCMTFWLEKFARIYIPVLYYLYIIF